MTPPCDGRWNTEGRFAYHLVYRYEHPDKECFVGEGAPLGQLLIQFGIGDGSFSWKYIHVKRKKKSPNMANLWHQCPRRGQTREAWCRWWRSQPWENLGRETPTRSRTRRKRLPGQIQSSDDLRVFFVTHLHRGDDEASVYNKLAEARRSFVAVPSMDKEQPSNVTKLRSRASLLIRN